MQIDIDTNISWIGIAHLEGGAGGEIRKEC